MTAKPQTNRPSNANGPNGPSTSRTTATIASGAPIGRSRAAWRRAWLLLIAVAVVGVALDLASKEISFRHVADKPVVLDRDRVLGDPHFKLPWHEGIQVLPLDLLDFRLVLNHGAVFGIGNGRRGVFIVITMFAIAAAIWVFRRWTSPGDRLTHIAVGLVLAGGIGNLYDRFVFGAVRDFLHMLPRWNLPFGLSWPGGNSEVFPWIFNFADMFLLAGMALLILTLHRGEKKAGENAEC